MGGGLVRREIDVGLHSPGARATVDGIYCIADKSHSDIVSEVKHIGVESVSKQDVRGVLGGTSRGIFQGKVYVDSGAQGSDGDQLHRALFLNRGPEVNVKPQLEIFADDVKCSHGATTGELDSKHLFYLLSRGIDEPTARALLISGFINDVSMNIQNKEVCALVLGLTNQWLNNEVNLKPVLYD
jgi:Fe-S cluster assembly protein SufD